MDKVMLSFDKVSAHYGKIQALHDVSLHINQGEIVTLIGANGAGKTTLLGTLCGDPRATSGRAPRLLAHDGGREPGDGRLFRRPRPVPGAHQVGVRPVPTSA